MKEEGVVLAFIYTMLDGTRCSITINGDASLSAKDVVNMMNNTLHMITTRYKPHNTLEEIECAELLHNQPEVINESN